MKYIEEPHPFCTKVAFQAGWPFARGRNQHIDVTIYFVRWSLQRGLASLQDGLSKGVPMFILKIKLCLSLISSVL